MDNKKSPNRTKRQAKILEDYWDCSVCTYRNTAEAFKCLMCDIRKGTSTRKPRINTQLVAQQVVPQFNLGAPKSSRSSKDDKHKRSSGGTLCPYFGFGYVTQVGISDVPTSDVFEPTYELPVIIWPSYYDPS